MESICDSEKYYRDGNGFMYKKSGENKKTLYLDCLRQPNCIAGARYYKDSQEWVLFSTHSDEKPDEHLLFKIMFEEFLKKEACKSENANTSVLNLYKRAKHTQFKGIWLPTNHQALFLQKLRRLRSYNKNEAKSKIGSQKNRFNRVSVQMTDAATSPTMPESLIVQRRVYMPKNSSLATLPGNAMLNSARQCYATSRQNSTQVQASPSVNVTTSPFLILPIQNQNVTPPNQSLIAQRMDYSPNSSQGSLLRYAISNSSKEAMVNQNSSQAQFSSNADGTFSPVLLPPIQFQNGTPLNQSLIMKRVYSTDKSTTLSSSDTITQVKSFNIRVVSNGSATPIITTSIAASSIPNSKNQAKIQTYKSTEKKSMPRNIRTRATTKANVKGKNVKFGTTGAGRKKMHGSLIASTEDIPTQTTHVPRRISTQAQPSTSSDVTDSPFVSPSQNQSPTITQQNPISIMQRRTYLPISQNSMSRNASPVLQSPTHNQNVTPIENNGANVIWKTRAKTQAEKKFIRERIQTRATTANVKKDKNIKVVTRAIRNKIRRSLFASNEDICTPGQNPTQAQPSSQADATSPVLPSPIFDSPIKNSSTKASQSKSYTTRMTAERSPRSSSTPISNRSNKGAKTQTKKTAAKESFRERIQTRAATAKAKKRKNIGRASGKNKIRRSLFASPIADLRNKSQ